MKLKKFTNTNLLIIAVVLAFASCTSIQEPIYLMDKGEIENEFANAPKVQYKVRPGDNLYIKIHSMHKKTNQFIEQSLPTDPMQLYLESYRVDPNGFVDISIIDKVKVQGLNVDEIKDLIEQKLNVFFKETTANVKLVNYTVTVLGEVNNPGDYLVTQEALSIFQAIGLAGGMKEWGNKEKVVLTRLTDTGSEIQYLDLTDKKVLESEYYHILPHDVIYIEPSKAKSQSSSAKRIISVAFGIIFMVFVDALFVKGII